MKNNISVGLKNRIRENNLETVQSLFTENESLRSENAELRRIIDRGMGSTRTELLLSEQLEDQRNGNIKLMNLNAELRAALETLLSRATELPQYANHEGLMNAEAIAQASAILERTKK